MSIDTVEAVHRYLGYTDADAEVLRSVKAVWQKLETLKRQAVRDSKYLRQYSDFLQKSLTQARASRPADNDEEWIASCKALWDWFSDEYHRLNIPDIEQRRGAHYLDWCAKWLPEQHMAYTTAVERLCTSPSQHHISEMKVAATALLRAYVAAIPDS